MRNYININKSLIPYGISIPLGAEIFNLLLKYNQSADLFTVGLSKGGEVITEAEPVIYGVPLFQDIYVSGKFPILNVVPYDESRIYSNVTWDNFGADVKLTIDSGGDPDEAV